MKIKVLGKILDVREKWALAAALEKGDFEGQGGRAGSDNLVRETSARVTSEAAAAHRAARDVVRVDDHVVGAAE